MVSGVACDPSLNEELALTPKKSALARLIVRLLPDTLGMRLVITGVLLAIVAAGCMAAIDLWLRSPVDTLAGPAAVIVPLLLILVVGLALGGGLTRLVRPPLVRMVERLKGQVLEAAAGMPVADEEIATDHELPVELREMVGFIQGLLQAQNERQTELEAAIREAEYAEEQLSVVVTESPEAKIVLQDGRILIANPAAAFALGLPASQLTDLTIAEAMHGLEIVDEKRVHYDADSLLDRALREPVTVSLTEPGRPARWYIFMAIRHARDARNRILLTARDVTEELRLESIRAEIVSLVSHDLRSPLTVVMGYLDLLSRPMAPEDHARALDAARRNAARMADLLEDLLSATRAQELLAVSELVPTPLTTLAEEVVSSLGPTHRERELRLEAECDPVVFGEEKRLRQVLVNLVTNAYKYSPDTGAIVVRVRCVEDSAVLEVIDHGPGIPEDERERVFERFERLENGAGRPGVGLGLYIVNIIVHNHAGSVRVEETPGGGASFVVELPLAGEFVDGEVVLREGATPAV